MSNPDLNGLFDDWQKGTVLLVAYEGGAAQGHLQSIINGIVSLSGPDAVVYVNGTAVAVVGPINIKLVKVLAVTFVAPV
ncbi:MAG TPA: hypothetical protein VN456_18190 [Desulfosporosinus sp.]|nr:hypothetical protein [Desulfosporosinus sp.]